MTSVASSSSSSNPLISDQQVTFQYANECDLEIHCSPFGLSGLYMRIGGANIMGIGSTMGLITGSTKGLIHYNNSNDLIDQKYKAYVVIDEEGMLRIDFTKITIDNNSKEGNNNNKIENNVSNAFENDDNLEEEIPTLVFKGPCPEGRPDDIEPFIGIFSFEKETS
ncbi:uncharacterized protein KGF55_000121 [Candida pseudojiufengensis]|uniref:uncharacterized protein n=1 Tax=Candida pseudojiufengensis TaxID=497109 RepID=UPI0022249E4E|nr:uncharacterized protein KGF55_000121 [Candida pseudojiufengensis]KAI5966712.1 hypothetical protein KGF55_000121 [Candida pseudojiufengensis]